MHYEFVVPLNTKSLHISFEANYETERFFPKTSTINNASKMAFGVFKVCECRLNTIDSNRMAAIKKTISESDWASAIEENDLLSTCIYTEIIDANAIVASKSIESEKLKRSFNGDVDETDTLDKEIDLFTSLSSMLIKKLELHRAMANLVCLTQNNRVRPSFQL